VPRQIERFQRVAAVFVADPCGRHYSSVIRHRARLRGVIVYPMLQRMLEDDLIVDGWKLQRKRWLARHLPFTRSVSRRYYTLTDKGRQQLTALVAET
jgi:hypothetical protein